MDTVVLRAVVPTPGPLNQNHGVWGLQSVFNQTLLGPPGMLTCENRLQAQRDPGARSCPSIDWLG